MKSPPWPARTRHGPRRPASTYRTIFPIAALEATRIPLDARVIRVNGRPVSTRAEALREWRRGRVAAIVLLRHDDRHFFAVLEEAR